MKKNAMLTTCMALSVAVLTALGAGRAAAEPAETPIMSEQAREEKHHLWLEKLNLSAAQKQKIDEIRQAQHDAIKASAEQLRAEHEKMRTLMQGDATDDQLREQHAKVAALRAAMGEARFETFLKIRAVLNRGQRKRMAELHHGGMGHEMRHGDGMMKGDEKP